MMLLATATSSNWKRGRSSAAIARFAALAIAASAGGVASEAWAATIVMLPNPTYAGNVGASADLSSVQSVAITGPGVTSAAATGIYGSTAGGSVNISLTPNPSIHATVSAATTPLNYGASGSVDVSLRFDYSFMIVDTNDPSLSVPIPVSVNASGGTSFSGTGELANPLLSQFSVSGVLDDQLSNTIVSGSLYPGPASWTDNNTYLMQTDLVYDVSMIVEADWTVYGGHGEGSGTASAFVDPTFALGAFVINPGQYSFEFSPGIGNAPSVPEPSTWAMMHLGFAGLGLLGHHASRRTAVAAS